METVRSILEGKGTAVWSVPPHASVYDALALMADKRIGALLVVEDGRLAGIFSERDYARKVVLMGRSSREMEVREVMTADVLTVSPEWKIAECMRAMTDHHIRHLPVVDCGRLLGVISIGDLVNAIISTQAETIEQLNSYIAGSYPG